jgi:diguanylate cyclase (GGDEF)-like protein
MVVQTIKNSIRQSDILARWGGEEFVIMLPQTNREQGVELAEHLRLVIEYLVYNNEGITCSFGVSEYKQGESLKILFERADIALYEAKQLGRNQVRWL